MAAQRVRSSNGWGPEGFLASSVRPTVGSMELELRHLKVVCAIAELGSVTKAASALGLAQPALTAQLQRIERTLGGALFERDRRGARPTALGELVLNRARVVLPAVDGLRDEAARMAGAGTLRAAVQDRYGGRPDPRRAGRPARRRASRRAAHHLHLALRRRAGVDGARRSARPRPGRRLRQRGSAGRRPAWSGGRWPSRRWRCCCRSPIRAPSLCEVDAGRARRRRLDRAARRRLLRRVLREGVRPGRFHARGRCRRSTTSARSTWWQPVARSRCASRRIRTPPGCRVGPAGQRAAALAAPAGLASGRPGGPAGPGTGLERRPGPRRDRPPHPALRRLAGPQPRPGGRSPGAP